MAQRLPPALEQELQRFEALRREHDTYQMMLQTLQNELSELKETLEELGKQPDSTVTFKTIGQIMFRTEKAKLTEEIQDREKSIEMRLGTLSKKREAVEAKLKELQAKIQIELGKANPRLQ
jgi:prefoldin beta subunit